MDTLGKRIKFIREKLNLNQSLLAKELGLESAVAISKYESDQREPDMSKLIKLSNIGGVSLDWLLTGEGSPHRPKEIEFEIYNLVPQSEDGEATYRTSWGFLTKSDIENTLKIPLGSLDEWLAKRHKDVMIVKEPTIPYEAKIKDQKLLNLIQKLEHIYKEGTTIERGQIRGIIEELYEDIKKKETLPREEVIEQKKVG